jgi:hypothetical protein
MRLGLAAAGLAAALVGSPSSANVVTIGFESGPYAPAVPPYGPDSGTNNFSTEHFVFSPGCHFDWETNSGGVPSPLGHWLGFDMGGCYDPSSGGPHIGYNTNYLGPGGPALAQGKMFVQHEFGQQFTLESFVFVSIVTAEGGLEVRSSKGGFFSTGFPGSDLTQYNFSGAAWTDVDWLEFTALSSGIPVGFDNLALSGNAIPEPNALALALLGCSAAALAWRQGRSARKI